MTLQQRWPLALAALQAVLDDRLELAKISIKEDTIYIGVDNNETNIGLKDRGIDELPEATLLAYVDALSDWLPATTAFWGELVPACPAHGGTHALQPHIEDRQLHMICASTDKTIRSVDW